VEVRFYRTASGDEPVRSFCKALPQKERFKVGRAIRSIQTFGLDAPNVSLRPVKGKLWEIRASAQRVFYVLASGGTLWLLHAYKKQGQKAPRGEIEIATSRMKEVLADR